MDASKKQTLIKIIWNAVSAILGLITGINLNI